MRFFQWSSILHSDYIISLYSICWRDPICFPQEKQISKQNYPLPLQLNYIKLAGKTIQKLVFLRKML